MSFSKTTLALFSQVIFFVFFFLFYCSTQVSASWLNTSEVGTLDSVHYLPPIYARDGLSTSSDVQNHYLVLSTPEVTAFDVTIQNANAINGTGSQINQTVSISKSSPIILTLSASPYGSSGYGALGIVNDAGLNLANTQDGLILTGSGGLRFYANIRHSSGSQWTSLTAKWQTALGKKFRSWHVYQNGNMDTVKSHFISIMAMEDDTTVNFSDIAPGITFVGGDSTPGPIVLDRYESYVLGVRMDQFSNLASRNDLNGTLVSSDKAIVMTSWSFLWWAEGNGRDIGTDQILPTDYLGTRFIVVEGSGWGAADVLETPIVVADNDDTEIYLKGSATPITTIDAGEYYVISWNEYPASGSMFIRTSQPAYVYQNTSSNSSNGNGLNFVAPIFANLETQEVLIADADQLGTPIISVIAPVTANVTVDGSNLTGGVLVPGNAKYYLYTITGKTADVEISSTEAYFVSMTSVSWNRWAAWFFVWFPNSYAVRDIITTTPGDLVNIDVLKNDVKWNHTFTVTSIISSPSNGTGVLLGDGTIDYTPNPWFSWVDTFSYQISNGLGITDIAEITVAIDNDGDGVGNIDDMDDDNDGIPDSIESLNGDTDGDGINDDLDLDSDGDGVYDLDEADHWWTDADNNGVLDGFAGDNGIVDSLETVAESWILNYTVWNLDGDSLYNYLDLDSDADGLPDNVEAQSFSWYIDPSYTYTEYGLHISYSWGLTPVNTDGTGKPDYLDVDSDDQGDNDTVEAGLTLTGTGGINGLVESMETIDDYSDVNGIFGWGWTLDDTDGDGTPDIRDDNFPPTDMSFTGSLDENSATGTTIGDFSTVDIDIWDSYTYTLVTGTGDTDNASFSFSWFTLISEIIADFEAKDTYYIRVRTHDGTDSYEEAFTVAINDLDEIAPAFSGALVVSSNIHTWYAKEGDVLTFTLQINPADTWGNGNTLDFEIGTGSTITTAIFTGSTWAINERTQSYTVQAGENGNISISAIDFSDIAGNILTGASFPYVPATNVIVDTLIPVISFWDDVSSVLVGSDTIVIDVSDTNLDISSLEYGFSADNICNTSDIYGNSFQSGTWFTIASEAENGNYICVKASDYAWNTSYQVSLNTLNIDATPPAITTPVNVSVSQTWAVIVWETDIASSSEVIYGLATIVDQSTGERDLSPRVTSHSVTLNNLLACTTYYYQTVSRDQYGNTLTDGIYTFRTNWCVWGANIEQDTTSTVVPNGTWGTVNLSQTWANLVDISVPIWYNTSHGICPTGTYFQLKKIEKEPVVWALGNPENNEEAISTYELSAYCDPDTRVTSFDNTIEVTMHYEDADTNTTLESSMRIYRYNTWLSRWEELNNCSVNYASNSITCETTNFSTFWVFGQKRSSGATGWYDRCWPLWDLSGNSYDGICEAPEEVSFADDNFHEWEDNTNENKEVWDDVILYSAPETEEKEVQKTEDYNIENDFSTCPVISDIQNPEYTYSSERFYDEDTATYKQEILKFAQIGIIDGYEDGNFFPKKNISRTEFLKIVLLSHCYEYKNMNVQNMNFIDVDKNAWEAKVIAKALELWIIHGDTYEIPREFIDKNLGFQYDLESIIALKETFSKLWLYSGNIDGYYTDDLVDSVYEFQKSVWLVSSPYDEGAGFWGPKTREEFFISYPKSTLSYFRPHDVISKAEAVKILMRMSMIEADTLDPLGYSDISVDWHIPYVRNGQSLWLFVPLEDNFKFYPDAGVNREDMLHMISELIQLY